MRFYRATNLELVRVMVTQEDRIWRAATDDFAPNRWAWFPNQDDRVWYVLAANGLEVITLFTFWPLSGITYDIHMTRAFGKAVTALRDVFGWFFDRNPQARRITASIPTDNPLAIRAANRAGMKKYGVNPASFQRNGILLDQVLFGVSKCQAL